LFKPGVNLGFLEAAIWMVSPVLGFRPSRAFLSETLKIPNPVMLTLSPDLMTLVTSSTKASNHSTPCFLVTPIFSASLPANSAFFTVKKVVTSSPSTSPNTNSYTSPDTFTETAPVENATVNTENNNDSYSNLASGAIFGSNSFLPSGLIQWIILAIIILLIVILARKLFGGEKNYHEAPMKHA